MGFAALGFSGEALGFKIEDLPEWIGIAKDLVEAHDHTNKEKTSNDNPLSQNDFKHQTGSEGSSSNDTIDQPFKNKGKVIYHRNGQYKTQNTDGKGRGTIVPGNIPATDTVPSKKTI